MICKLLFLSHPSGCPRIVIRIQASHTFIHDKTTSPPIALAGSHEDLGVLEELPENGVFTEPSDCTERARFQRRSCRNGLF